MKCDQLRTELKKRNQRMTAQRDIVLKSFIEAETDHLSADEAYQKVMEKNCRISKATVYRTVELLAGLGLLRRIVFRDGIIRYELVKKGEHHHHHVVCNRCGSVVEFPLDNLDDLEELVDLAVVEVLLDDLVAAGDHLVLDREVALQHLRYVLADLQW